MKSFFKTLLASLLGSLFAFFLLVFIGIGLISLMVSGLMDQEVSVKEHSVLTLRLEQSIPERSSKNPFAGFSPMNLETQNQTGLNDILRVIQDAQEDENIQGILIESNYSPNSYATLQEIRDALVTFKKSGKFIYAYGEMMEEHAYFIASVADSIFIHPTGEFLLNGTAQSVVYVKGMLDKLGVEAQLIRHGKYKSAGEPFIADKMSDANREQILSYVSSIYKTFIQQIALSRNIHPDSVFAYATQLRVQSVNDAFNLGLIDGLFYRDQVEELLKKQTGTESKKDLNLISVKEYARKPATTDYEEKNKIAIVYAVGEIVSGESSENDMGSETMVKALKKVRSDSSVKAVVLRINSPGGSALASDVIWREVVLTQKTKPVVVSMGAVAASGGYYIAAPASVIVAQPNTITGSIGVFGMIPNAGKLLNEKLGLRFEKVKIGEFSDLGSIDRPLTPAETAIIQRMIDRIYDDFISKVAEGRKMTREQVDALAQGRVWSGTDALQIQLADTLGGIRTALAIAAQKAGIESYKMVAYPRLKDPIEQLLKDVKTQAGTWFLKQELGDSYSEYIHLKNALLHYGIQARMDHNIIYTK